MHAVEIWKIKVPINGETLSNCSSLFIDFFLLHYILLGYKEVYMLNVVILDFEEATLGVVRLVLSSSFVQDR